MATTTKPISPKREGAAPMALDTLSGATAARSLLPVKQGKGEQKLAFGFGAMHDVPITLVFEVGKVALNIGEFLALGKGSIVELSHVAVDAIDVFIDDILVAHGELITFKDKYGVRFGEIVGIAETGQDS